jgi:hypothetical protein
MLLDGDGYSEFTSNDYEVSTTHDDFLYDEDESTIC